MMIANHQQSPGHTNPVLIWFSHVLRMSNRKTSQRCIEIDSDLDMKERRTKESEEVEVFVGTQHRPNNRTGFSGSVLL